MCYKQKYTYSKSLLNHDHDQSRDESFNELLQQIDIHQQDDDEQINETDGDEMVDAMVDGIDTDSCDGSDSRSRLVSFLNHVLGIKCIIYVLLYLFGICMIMIYLICTSLPEKNVFNFDGMILIFISSSISVILSINNSYVVRFMVDSFEYFSPSFINQHGCKLKAFFRINNIIICPMIFSLFILNDCGKFWINFWNYCTENELKQIFDIEFNYCQIRYMNETDSVLIMHI